MDTLQPFLLMFIFCLSPLPSTTEYLGSLHAVHDLQSRLITYGADVCSRSDSAMEVELLVVINSAADNVTARQRARVTWLDQWTSRFIYRKVRVVFFVDKPKDLKQAASLSAENALHHDIVWTNVEEAASDSTMKAASWLNWAMNWCPRAKFVLKVEENKIVNLPAVVEFVEGNKNANNKIWGSVIRDGILQWFGRFFLNFQPRYCSPEVYLMTGDVVKKLFIGGLKQIPYNKMENIYFTGLVAKNEGINVINNNNFKENDFPLNIYNNEAEASHALSSKKCSAVKNSMVFSTNDNKEEWTVQWKYLLWAFKKCNIAETLFDSVE